MSFAKLDQRLIVNEAVSLLKEGGLDAVSLRRIAARLNVSVSSLYWHVRDKEALYSLMASSIFRDCLEAVPPADRWEQWLEGFGEALWAAQLSIPDAHRLIALTRANEASSNDALQDILQTLERLGLARKDAFAAQRSVQALVTGWTALQHVSDVGIVARHKPFKQALDVLIGGWSRSVDGAGP